MWNTDYGRVEYRPKDTLFLQQLSAQPLASRIKRAGTTNHSFKHAAQGNSKLADGRFAFAALLGCFFGSCRETRRKFANTTMHLKMADLDIVLVNNKTGHKTPAPLYMTYNHHHALLLGPQEDLMKLLSCI